MVLGHAHAAFALDRFDQDRGGLRPDRLLHGFKVAERDVVEAFDHGAEAIEILLVSGSRERRERAAVEGAFERDDAVALRAAIDRLELARGLDRAFHRLGAGIREEHIVGEARRAEPVGKLLLLGHAEQVRHVDRLVRLRGDRLGDLRMRMAERVHRNARGEVEIALAIGGGEPHALAVVERKVDTRKRRKKMRCAHGTVLGTSIVMARPEMKCAASPGGTFKSHFRSAPARVNTKPLRRRCQPMQRYRIPLRWKCHRLAAMIAFNGHCWGQGATVHRLMLGGLLRGSHGIL